MNALIGMCNRVSQWPSNLAQEGFTCTALQTDVLVVVDGRRVTLTPEAVLYSAEANEALLIECKSATLDPLQARKYAAVTGLDLAAAGCVPASSAATCLVTPVYFCREDNVVALRRLIDDLPADCADLPLVGYNHQRFRLVRGRFNGPRTRVALNAEIWFEERFWPTRYVPYDVDSPDRDLLTPLANELRARLMLGIGNPFTAEILAGGDETVGSDGCVPNFALLGGAARRRTIGRVRVLVEELRYHCLDNYLSRPAPGQWSVIRKPERSQSFRRLNECLRLLRRHMEGGTTMPRARLMDEIIGTEAVELAGED